MRVDPLVILVFGFLLGVRVVACTNCQLLARLFRSRIQFSPVVLSIATKSLNLPAAVAFPLTWGRAATVVFLGINGLQKHSLITSRLFCFSKEPSSFPSQDSALT